MPIEPLPVFEADADPHHRASMTAQEAYNRLEPPASVVVRFGYLKLVAEYPYDGDVVPGCGTKLVARTHRGTEIVEMLTTTCENSGCGKSVSRQEMLDYIENSGGRDFPFRTDGKILHVATIEELNKQAFLDSKKTDYVRRCKMAIDELELPMKLVEVEQILGEELLTFYFMAKDRVDFRKLVRRLAAEFKTRIEMRQVGARDEARLVADYERCGQHCCCKSFLKVLKPVSMKSAKLQKATLDPLKISGRCGRLMCCLRYEDKTYNELRKKLPKKGKRVGTNEGPGRVLETKVLVQLVLVRLEHNDQAIAVPVEELMDPEQCPKPGEREAAEAAPEPDPLRGLSAEEAAGRGDDRRRSRRRRSGGKRTTSQQQDAYGARAKKEQGDEGRPARRKPEAKRPDQDRVQSPPDKTDGTDGTDKPDRPKRKRRRRRRRSGSAGSSGNAGGTPGTGNAEGNQG
jgi:cell fate regulator YaaT (PSP1 superfamily)